MAFPNNNNIWTFIQTQRPTDPDVLSDLMNNVFQPTNEFFQSNYDGMYKNWGRLSYQEQRRRDLLDVQRSNRYNKLDTSRGIVQLVKSVEDTAHKGGGEKKGYKPSIYVAGFTKVFDSYKNVLMLSEWLVEKPADFDDNWYVVPCPKGTRSLVVACMGATKIYNKHGMLRSIVSSALPGGNKQDPALRNQCVVLDCFHVPEKNTLYVLDLLAWNSMPMTDGEAEFRHFWLKTHMDDITELKTLSTKNKILFEVLPKVDCDQTSLNKFMMKFPHFPDFVPTLDGLLFYHKRAQYVSGVTPLVGWLYPYMVNEVLGEDIEVNRAYELGRPKEYVNQAQFIQHFEANAQKKVSKKSKPQVENVTNTAEMPHPSNQAQREPMDTSSRDAAGDNEKKKRHRQRNRGNRRNGTNDATMTDGAVMETDDIAALYQRPFNPTIGHRGRMTRISRSPNRVLYPGVASTSTAHLMN